MTYGSNVKKYEKSHKEKKADEEVTKNFVSVKTYDPVSGGCFKIKLYKTKELSRILSLFGPRGVQMTKKKPTEETFIVEERGMASLMANREFAAEDVKKEETPVQETSQKKPKNKKKGKKR